MRTEFSTLDIVKALGIPRERLRDWMNRSFIVPSSSAHGQGTKAVFTRHDVYGIVLFRLLINSGFSRSVAGTYVKYFLKKEKEKFGQQDIVYIKFLVDRDGGPPLCQILPEGDWRHDFSTGVTMQGNEKAEDIPQKEENEYIVERKWSSSQIINFRNLRQDVDLKLSRL